MDPTVQARAPAPVSFDAEECLRLYVAGERDAISERLLRVLDAAPAHALERVDEGALLFIDRFVQTLLFLFARPDWVPRDADALRFIDHNQTIANLAANSSLRSTDTALRQVLVQTNNFAKILVLASPRNEVQVDPKRLFDASPEWASRWWFAYVGNDYGKLASPIALRNLRRHLAAWDERMTGVYSTVHEAYFGATYIAPGPVERRVKEGINRLIRREWVPRVPVLNRPDPKRAVVVSGAWYESHAVYRTLYRFVDALAERFELTLAAIGPTEPATRGFKEVLRLPRLTEGIGPLADNRFALAFFPDIGMTLESVYLSNLRLAPIQISTLGHPASSFGGDIDYCVGGIDAERADLAAENYSERLLLVPGIGMGATPIDAPRHGRPKPAEPVLISCPWSAPKTTHEMLLRLRHIRERARRPVVFQFFPAHSLRSAGYRPFTRAVAETVGEAHVRVHPPLTRARYYEALQEGHFAIDAFPFGGMNSLCDALHFGLPFVAWEGTRAFNRFAAAFCRANGLEALVATDEASWTGTVLRLIDDEPWRAEMQRRAAAVDLARSAVAYDPGPAFRRALDHILAHHETLRRSPDRSPLVFA